jgi:hypothetical protein
MWRFHAWVRALNPAQIYARLEARFAAVALSSGVAATIDSVLVDSYRSATWDLQGSHTDGRAVTRRVQATHDGTTGADATAATWCSDGVGVLPATITIAPDVSGATTSQLLRLRVTASESGWRFIGYRVALKDI